MSQNKNELNIVFSSAGKSGLAFIVGYIISFFSSILIARIVGASILGQVSLGLSVTTITSFFIMFGIDNAVLKNTSYYLGKGDNFSIQQSIHYAILISSIISLFFILLYFFFLKEYLLILFPNMSNIIIITDIFVFLIPFISLKKIFNGAITGLQAPQYVKFANKVFHPSVRIIVFLLLIYFWGLLNSLIAATMFAIIMSTIFLIIVYRNRFERNNFKISSHIIDYKKLYTFILFSISLTFIPLFNIITQQGDLIVVGHFLSSQQTGVYAVVRRIGSLVTIPLAIFAPIVAATISKLFAKRDEDSIKKIYQFSTKWVFILSGVLFSTIMITADELLKIFGDDFKTGALALRIFAFGQLVNASVGPSGNVLIMMEKTKVFIVNGTISLILGFMTAILLVPIYGIVGNAIGISIALGLLNILSIYYISYVMKIYPGSITNYITRFSAIGITTYLGYNLMKILNLHYLITICLLFLFSSVLIILLIYLSNDISTEDKLLLKSLKNKFNIIH